VHAFPRLRVIPASEVGSKEIPLRAVLPSGGPECEVEQRVDHGTLNQWKRATPPNRPFHDARHDRSRMPREARRRTFGTLIKEADTDRGSAVSAGHASTDAHPYSGCAANSRVKTSPSAPKVPRSRPSTCASTAPASPVQMLNEPCPSKVREKPGSAIPS
jgi:hypothetical protein